MGKRKRKKRHARDSRSDKRPGTSKSSTQKWLYPAGAVIALIIAGAVVVTWTGRDRGQLSLRVPEFTAAAERGARAFASNCAQCHGTNAAGTDRGPPLVHKIYEPSHHDDIAIRRAIRLGVRSHHWRYGSMPKVAVSNRQIDGIINYIRELQRANGIR